MIFFKSLFYSDVFILPKHVFTARYHAAEQFDKTDKAYLHNIDEDPGEETNLLDENPEIVHKMVQRLKFYWKGMVPSPNPERDLRADPKFRSGFWEPWIEWNFWV